MTRFVTGRLASTGPTILVGGAAVAASLVASPSILGLLGAALALLMLAIAATDAHHYIIPDELTIAAVVLGLVSVAVEGPSGVRVEALGFALARGLFLVATFFLLREAYFRLRGRQGLGLGDVKLSAVAGVWLDVAFIPVAIEIAALGAIAAYLARQFLLRRPVSASARLPFGLFLAPSIWVAWFAETILRSL
jgi:leader peptidase (prepilin peptidase)/N-methyltransferase